MSINILPGTPETLNQMKGQKFVPHSGEGIVFVKLMFIKPDTMEDGDPAKLIQDTEGVIMCGQLDEIQKQLDTWFTESKVKYRATSGERKEPQPPTERW